MGQKGVGSGSATDNGLFLLPMTDKELRMGEYPGADYRMSMYGLRERNPEEAAGQWKERIKVNQLLSIRIYIMGA